MRLHQPLSLHHSTASPSAQGLDPDVECVAGLELGLGAFDDPIRQAFRYIYAKTAELMDAMSRKPSLQPKCT